MKLYVNQKVFSLNSKYYVKDEYGEDKYYIEGELLTIGRRLHIYDMQGNEVAFVRQKIGLLPRFIVSQNGCELAEITKVIGFRPKYVIDGLPWEVKGDFFNHDYEILSYDMSIVNIHKAWMSWGDAFELDIHTDNEIMALAVTLAIDCVLDNSQNN